MSIHDTGGRLFYWRTPSGSEFDFIWARGRRAIGIEVKAATDWRGKHGASLQSLIDVGALQAGFGVYNGRVELKDGPLRVLPLKGFLSELSAGSVLQ